MSLPPSPILNAWIVASLRPKRHTIEGLKAIRAKSPMWLKNAIDLALITAQRRGDILNIRFEDIKDGYLYVIQSKTEKASDARWIRFTMTPQPNELIIRCRSDGVLSPYLIHRRRERRSLKGRSLNEGR
jgi:integrase